MAIDFPNIGPDLFTIPAIHVGGAAIGPFSVRWYALAYIAGILLGWRYAISLVTNPRIWGGRGPTATRVQIDDLILWLTIGVIVGGRLGYIAFYMLPVADSRAALLADPWEAIRVWHGGMSFHGGALGVVLALFLFAAREKIPVLRLADLVAACTPIGLFFGRIANFINGELWGRPTHLPWGVVFCSPTIPTDVNGTCIAGLAPRHPSELYEAALEGVVLFLLLRWATHRAGWLQKNGAVTGLFLLGYGVFRVSLEHVRMPDVGLRDLPFGLTMGMILSSPMIVVGALLIWRALAQAPDLPTVTDAP
jgi:phosphatidylglycerol:prolipoprotein diacylglycerol transferase